LREGRTYLKREGALNTGGLPIEWEALKFDLELAGKRCRFLSESREKGKILISGKKGRFASLFSVNADRNRNGDQRRGGKGIWGKGLAEQGEMSSVYVTGR